jgi:general secretion pathway protein L
LSISLTFADLQRVTSGSQSSLRRFWMWWTGELRGALPPRLQRYLHDADRTLRVSLHERQLHIAIRDAEGTQQIADFELHESREIDLARVRVILEQLVPGAHTAIIELPQGQIFRRTVNLPISTEERLADVLKFEMDRFTPFDHGQVYFAHRVTRRDTGSGQVTVQLVVVLRSLVDQMLAVLDDCGLEVSAITVAGQNSGANADTWNLLPAERRPRSGLRGRLLPLSLTTVFAVLLLAALTLPLFYQQNVLRDLEQEIDTLRPAAMVAAETRDSITALLQRQGFFASQRAASPTVVSLLNEVTRVIPDNTWLVRVEVRGSTLRIQGESKSASSLIALLEASNLIENAAFSSPVTKNPRTSNDRFVIEARVRFPGDDEQ